MSNVKILSPEIVAKIAAGEVIERPASVLKELIENSLDAGADTITVSLEEAGKKRIEISDNGSGISEEDLKILFNRHATSKISIVSDLYAIESFGFRGEALYSISAVSDITISSKQKNSKNGWEIHTRAGNRLGLKPQALNTGTIINVTELFFNTPARKKFLKSNTTELAACIDAFIPYTLLYPQAQFKLTHNDKVILDLAKQSSHIKRCANALNLNTQFLIDDTQELSSQNASIHLVLGDINIQRTRKDMQFIFVNNRPVSNKTISYHLNDVYRLLFSPGVYPFFCCFITVPAENVDVNVHPSKREVKIKDESIFVQSLRKMAEHVLMTQSKAKQSQNTIFSLPNNDLTRSTNTKEALLPPIPDNTHTTLSFEENKVLFSLGPLESDQNNTIQETLQQSRYVGSLFAKYLVFEAANSMLLIDQHAAHERITFEKLKKQFESAHVEMQQLIAPITVSLSPQEIIEWEETAEIFEKIGFVCTMFDKETLAIHAHPALIKQPDIAVRNLLAGKVSTFDPEMLARMACRSSVMAGQILHEKEAQEERKQLLACADPFTCPHGRPTVIEIKESQISKQFLRT